MALDYLAFKRIILLIGNYIKDGKILKINQISNEEFLFVIRKDYNNYNLLISTHPNTSYINLTVKKPDSNHINTNLLMLLRKHLENGVISSFCQQNDDRIVLMTILNRDDYFRNTEHKLYVELIGRASNLILTNNEFVIIDSLKKIPLAYQNLRTIQPGIHYTLPAKPEDEKLPYDLENEIDYTKKSIDEIKRQIEASDTIYITKKDNKIDFHFIPFTFMEGEVSSYKWNEGLDNFYSNSLSIERHRQFASDMEKLARNEIKKSEKKIKKLTEELNISKESGIYRYYGDLLLTYCQGKKLSGDKIEILDECENRQVQVPINSQFDVYYNANQYYKKYQKSKVAIVKIQEQIDLCNENIDYFENVLYQLSDADYLAAMEIKEELTEQGYFKRYHNIPTNNKNKKKKEKVYRPLLFKYENVNIYVGQNNLQNEYLTFKRANKNHMFLHVQPGHGAHVVIASDNVSDSVKKFGALLAAYYSSYKNSSTVPVNYTLVKNIKKIPGGKIGKVIINNYKTIYVDPDYDLIKDYLIK